MTTPATGQLTAVTLESTSGAEQQAVPFAFGQVFKQGEFAPADSLVGRTAGVPDLPLQVDVKATHPDGSVRHAIISGLLPGLAGGQSRHLGLTKTSAASANAVTLGDMLRHGFAASVHATLNGVEYSARAEELLNEDAKTWLAGPVATEWLVSAPLTTNSGQAHPHLTARFAIRWYEGVKKARVDVTLENNWAYEPAPQNFTYDAKVLVAAKPVYTKAALTHLHHARWRKVFWWGGEEPQVNIKHNTAYLIGTRALPNYDQTLVVPESSLASLKTKFTGAITEPMAVGMATTYMPQTGGRPDIGLLPSWAATYLLSMDKRARDATLGTADLAGSWSSHYRDKNTDRPVSLLDYPYMTILGRSGDTRNPATKQLEAFPAGVPGACKTPNTHDVSHQPAFAYLPYLVTGDYYYLEELQFWATYNVFSSNPGYRENIKGLLKAEQVRGQAWSLRTLAEAAYITPDSDDLKGYFNQVLSNNLDWYNATYTDNPGANALGAVVNGPAVVYADDTGLAPWMDDFFTSAVGHAAELGFDKAARLLGWKAKFQIGRMIAPDCCWTEASIYSLKVRDSKAAPLYATLGECFSKTIGARAALPCNSPERLAQYKADTKNTKYIVGEMVGYSHTGTGYPSNLQPALAMAVDSGAIEGGARAWGLFEGRSIKPNYGEGPQFAIVPRPKAVVPPVVEAPSGPGKIVTPSNVKLAKLKALTVAVFDPVKLDVVQEFRNLSASSRGAFTITDLALVRGVQYAASVTDASGRVLDIMFPLLAV